MFEIHKIDRSQRAADEPLGSKSKFWFWQGGSQFLFKAEERGTGEDWAEKIVCHLCELLGLPHVHYELAAEYDGSRFVEPGVICETCAPRPTSLVLGNQLLLDRDPSYSPVALARPSTPVFRAPGPLAQSRRFWGLPALPFRPRRSGSSA